MNLPRNASLTGEPVDNAGIAAWLGGGPMQGAYPRDTAAAFDRPPSDAP